MLPSSRLAVAVMAARGRRTRPATSQPSPIETSAITAKAAPDWAAIWLRAAVSSWRRTLLRSAMSLTFTTSRSEPGADPRNTTVLPAAGTGSPGVGSGAWTLVSNGRLKWDRTRA